MKSEKYWLTSSKKISPGIRFLIWFSGGTNLFPWGSTQPGNMIAMSEKIARFWWTICHFCGFFAIKVGLKWLKSGFFRAIIFFQLWKVAVKVASFWEKLADFEKNNLATLLVLQLLATRQPPASCSPSTPLCSAVRSSALDGASCQAQIWSNGDVTDFDLNRAKEKLMNEE